MYMTGVFKSTKKLLNSANDSITLDIKHKEMLIKFKKDFTGTKPELELEKKNLLLRLKSDKLSVDERISICDILSNLKMKLKKIKKAEKDYLLNNSQYIFEYFENKKNIAECKNKPTMLEHFFNTKDAVMDEVKTKEISYVHKYLTNINESCLDISNYTIQTDVCKFCNKGDLIPLEHEGILICNSCFKHTKYLIENEKPSYKEPPKEVCFYAYKRINHFREILAQFQAKETTQIPEGIIEDILQQIKKERISLSQLTNKRTKDILKKLGYNKYYEHIPFIKDKLGIKPPIMSAELEITLCNLFMDIQAPYAKYCPDYRINFLNYYYTVYKLCELLDQQQFLPYFPMLKDREKRIEQDVIWKNICDELDWEFIPTV
jgi:hypothetical protein